MGNVGHHGSVRSAEAQKAGHHRLLLLFLLCTGTVEPLRVEVGGGRENDENMEATPGSPPQAGVAVSVPWSRGFLAAVPAVRQACYTEDTPSSPPTT